MSGYDFFSGFLGSLGQQMQQKKQQKLAVEEEDRQFQRAMSREEVLARHRERFAIAAEERRQQAQPPEAFQELVDGQLMSGLRTWNPKKRAYELHGKMAPVAAHVVDTRNVDGNVVQYKSDGTHVVLGKSDAGVRASTSVDVAKIRAANSPKPAGSAPTKDALAGEVRRETRAVMRDWADEAKRRNNLEAYGLDPETGTREQLKQAVENEIRGIKPEPKSDMPGFTELFMDGTEAKIPSAKPEPQDEKIAQLIAKVRSSAGQEFANDTDEQILQYLKETGQIR